MSRTGLQIPAEVQVSEWKRLILGDLKLSTSVPSLMPHGHPSVLPGLGIPGWHMFNAPGITTNSNSKGQGINRLFKPKNSPDWPASLDVIWMKAPSLSTQMLGSCPCETWTSRFSFLNLSFLTWKMRLPDLLRGLSWAPRVKVHLQCQAQGHALAWTYRLLNTTAKECDSLLPQRLGVGAANPGGRGCRTGRTFQLWPLPSAWPWGSHPPLLSLTPLSQEMRTVTPLHDGSWGDTR